jgi:hypothetical protein
MAQLTPTNLENIKTGFKNGQASSTQKYSHAKIRT